MDTRPDLSLAGLSESFRVSSRNRLDSKGVWCMFAARKSGWRPTVRAAAALAAGVGLMVTVNAQAPSAAADVTYTKDIAPILQRSCENCHRADGVAPMSLTNYDEVRPWARAIKQRT